MALTPTEEAQVRQLLAEQNELLTLANNEATIMSKLGATKVTLSDLTAVATLVDADLMLARQSGTDKKTTAATILSYIAAGIGSNAVFQSSKTANGYQKLPGGIILQWASGVDQGASGNQVINLPIAFPTAHLKTIVSNLYLSGSQNGGYGFISATTSAITVARNNVDNGNGVTPLIFSIGY